jgi:Nucleotidyl transferase AbiEii toxin, Type IV TA system
MGASAWCRRLVSLDPLHEKIARTAVALPEAKQVALAGGGAMLAHDLVDRPTQDVDLFAPDPDEVTRLSDALAVALRTEGAQVCVDRRGPGFTRLGVTVADGRSVVVEVAHDARIREAVQLSFDRVL